MGFYTALNAESFHLMSHKVWKEKPNLPSASSPRVLVCSARFSRTPPVSPAHTALPGSHALSLNHSLFFHSSVSWWLSCSFQSHRTNICRARPPGRALHYTHRRSWQENQSFTCLGRGLGLGTLREEPVRGHHWQSPTLSPPTAPPPRHRTVSAASSPEQASLILSGGGGGGLPGSSLQSPTLRSISTLHLTHLSKVKIYLPLLKTPQRPSPPPSFPITAAPKTNSKL